MVKRYKMPRYKRLLNKKGYQIIRVCSARIIGLYSRGRDRKAYINLEYYNNDVLFYLIIRYINRDSIFPQPTLPTDIVTDGDKYWQIKTNIKTKQPMIYLVRPKIRLFDRLGVVSKYLEAWSSRFLRDA